MLPLFTEQSVIKKKKYVTLFPSIVVPSVGEPVYFSGFLKAISIFILFIYIHQLNGIRDTAANAP